MAVSAFLVACGTPLASARVLALPGNTTIEATGPSGAIFTYDPSGFTCTPPSGSTFPLGPATTVSCVDGASLPAGSFTVMVVDTTPPVVTAPANATATTGVPSGATVTYGAATATDLVSGALTPTCSPSSGSNFPVGTTTVTCSATDGAGNTGTATLTVTVNLVDTTPPTLSVPGPITAEATGPGGAAVTFSVSATDLVDPSPTVSCSPASGSSFPLGTTPVSCTAKDASSNTSPPSTFNVTVADTTAPTFTAIPSGTVTREATGPSGASYSFTVSATDAVTSSPGIVCNHAPSGETYGLGTTPVSCTATDTAGNPRVDGFALKIADSTAPTITSIPTGTVTLDATSPAGASYSFTVSAVDANAVDPSPVIVCDHGPSSATYPLGTTPVSCTAKDASNNLSAPATFVVTVRDAAPPTVSVPGTITKEATGASGAVAAFSVTAVDAIDPSPTVSCSSASGSTFPIGTTPVSCTATDASSNTSAPASFNVKVEDTTAPVITAPANVNAEATGPSGAAVNYPAATASDIVDGTTAASCSPASGSTFGFGDTTVTCNATDARGNRATAKTFTITVRDTTPPAFTRLPAPITVEANGPGGSIVNFTNPTAADLVDGPIAAVGCVPASASLFPLGNTTVTCSATDTRGNKGSKSFSVTVADTTPPTLYLPPNRSVVATFAGGIPSSSPAVTDFVTAVRAVDVVDPRPIVIVHELPTTLPVGANLITFEGRDAAGNEIVRTGTLTVLPLGSTSVPPPAAGKPPADVTSFKVVVGDRFARLTWAGVPGAVKYIVFRSERSTRRLSVEVRGQVVYQGSATTFTDRGLTNGAEYRYVVVSEDSTGNQSAGVAAVAAPHRDLLLSPNQGARLRGAPRLVWRKDADASYYNAQLFFNSTKVLSAWPKSPSYALKKTWTFGGRKYTLKPGLYRWYVWPGYGERAQADYGPLLGFRSFLIVR